MHPQSSHERVQGLWPGEQASGLAHFEGPTKGVLRERRLVNTIFLLPSALLQLTSFPQKGAYNLVLDYPIITP